MSGDSRQLAFDVDGGPWWETAVVVCPKCGCRAERDRERRVTCPSCAFSKATTADRCNPSASRDPVSGLDLWLQTPCCGQVLWAWNIEHVLWMQRYVEAKLRARRWFGGWRNNSLQSRLPKWITSAKNREPVLKGLEKLIERDLQSR
jgi:hypothetical protein